MLTRCLYCMSDWQSDDRERIISTSGALSSLLWKESIPIVWLLG